MSHQETRSEKIAFAERLAQVHMGDRIRLLQEHRSFLSGERPTDADFESARPLPADRFRVGAITRPRLGKDACYLRRNRQILSQQRRAVAAKTLAGSGKARLKASAKVDDEAEDESWEPDEDESDAEDDEEMLDELETVAETKSKKAPKQKKVVKPVATPKEKKPRKKSASTLAKETRLAAAAAKRSAAAKSRQEQARAAQKKWKEAKEAARKRLIEAKRKKRKPDTAATTKQPKKLRTCPHEEQNSGDDSAIESALSVETVENPATPPEATPSALCTEAVENPANLSADDTGSGEALNSDCDEDEEEMLFDDINISSEDSDVPSEIPEAVESLRNSPPAVVFEADSLTDEDTEIDWPILDSTEMLNFAKDEAALAKMKKSGWNFDPSTFPPDHRYPGLYDGPYGPSEEVTRCADSPLDLFQYFMPKALWTEIAKQSTIYHEQHLVKRVDRMYEKQRVPGKKTKEEIMEQEARHEDIQPHEIVNVLGLLIARMINPQRRHFYDHWATTGVGAIPGGTFGKYVKRNRFMYILSNLHFTDNADARAGTDRAWKVRSVIDVLQTTFKTGYTTPPVIALDEAMIPLHNRHNPTRQYVANKPHKWGTKLFMTCCAKSSYCLRLEVYCGKAQHTHELGNVPESVPSVDHNTGPAAVMRNLEAVLPSRSNGVYYLVVTDRYYTSVQLAYQLLSRQVYCVGTIQEDRQGFSNVMGEKNRSRPKSIPHGSYRMAVAKNCPLMTSLVWWDRRPVQLLATGASRSMETCHRWKTGGVREEIPCPSMMRDYHRWMGGVDVHDQLRLQRYSLQQQTKCKKYYKAIFLGLVDIAIVNAYVVYRDIQKKRGAKANTHAEFLMQLQAEMLEMKKEDFVQREPQPDEEASIPRALPSDHVPQENPDYQIINGQRKRRQRQCKVCSNRKHNVGERRATKYYCPGCSPSDKARTYLCNKVWPHTKNNTLTCHQIWHFQWNNGTNRPRPRCGRDIQNRESGGTGKRKRHRRAINNNDAEDSVDNTAADNVDDEDCIVVDNSFDPGEDDENATDEGSTERGHAAIEVDRTTGVFQVDTV